MHGTRGGRASAVVRGAWLWVGWVLPYHEIGFQLDHGRSHLYNCHCARGLPPRDLEKLIFELKRKRKSVGEKRWGRDGKERLYE